MLVSGSQDTTVVVWDPLGESPLFSLKGHKDQVTAVVCTPVLFFSTVQHITNACLGGGARQSGAADRQQGRARSCVVTLDTALHPGTR